MKGMLIFALMSFVICGYETKNGVLNTTYAIDRCGNIVGRYFKAHPAPSEVKTDLEGGHELDVEYSYTSSEPYVLEMEGRRPWLYRNGGASVDKAHANGILCNVFYADDSEEAKEYFNMGIDTVLTNGYLTIYNVVKDLLNEKNFNK